MRLLAVRLQNLNSLSGTHEVRFDVAPLSAAGVFLITGSTGAGKSTLLDAMTLALYGRAARYGNDKADEMMSRHTAECFAEVDFETGGRKLRSTWRLGKTKTGNLKPVQRTLADATTLEILADKGREMDAMVESLTGLDVDRFLRSVLLAQGQFAAFLKAKPNERAELLEKITGTEIYRDLSILAHETHKAKDEAVMRLKAGLGALTVLDDETRAELEKNLTEAREATTRLQTENQAAAQRLNEQRRWQQLQRERAGIDTERAKLTEAQKTLTQSYAGAAADVLKSQEVLNEAKRLRTAREPVWEQATTVTAQSAQYETQLVESRGTYQTWAKEQKEAALRREAAEKALQTHAEATQALDEWLKEHEADVELAEKVVTLRVAVQEWRGAYVALEEGRRLHAEAQALKQRQSDGEKNALGISVALKASHDKLSALRMELERVSKQHEVQWRLVDEAQRVAGFDEHRQDLKPGEACPLCGSLEHPFAEGVVSFESQLQAARKLMTGLEQQREKLNREVATADEDRVRTEEKLNSENARIAETKKLIATSQAPDDARLAVLTAGEVGKRVSIAKTPDDAERELGVMEKRSREFVKRRDEANEKRSQRQKIEADIQLATQDAAAKAKRLEELKAEGIALKTKADALKKTLSELLGERTLLQDRAWHEEHVSLAEKAWRDGEAKTHALHTQIAETKAKLDQLDVRRLELEKQLTGVEAVTAEVLAELEKTTAQIAEQLAANQKSAGALEERVRSDEAARKRREAGGAEVQAAEDESLRWGRLKELIGSADGAKFSRFAQSLTLRQLIGLANEHLKVLAERYRLMAAAGDELDLRIVDLYQANVDRPMESLSGGESFLASLALALGLSELASRHHPIDSLFIDEGFGTLDSETLEVALSALENLRSRGKTIGLISHVDLLKERLTTQVRVLRGAGGTSRIEVVA